MTAPRWTPAQKLGAEFMLAELRRAYLARLDYMALVLGIMEVADACALPVPYLSDSIAHLSLAIDDLAGDLERAVIVAPDQPVKAAA